MKKLMFGMIGAVIVSGVLLTGCATIKDIVVPVKRVEIKSQLAAPMFYVNSKNSIDGTWDYLAKDEAARKVCRDAIKATCTGGETPAITFLLSAQDGNTSFARSMWNNATFPNVNSAGLKEVSSLIQELCKEGFAVFPCLYSDGGGPSWTKIGDAKVQAGWQTVAKEIAPYCNGVLLSIEANEAATSVGQLSSAVAAMKTAFPGVPMYGIHLQFHSMAHTATYIYRGSANKERPEGLDLIWMEFPWNMTMSAGDAEGLEGIKRDYQAIRQRENLPKIVWAEFNLNAKGSIMAKQRSWLRDQKYNGQKEFGVGTGDDVKK